MNKVQIFNYNGCDIAFQLGSAVMVSATEMAKPFGKSPTDWLKNSKLKGFYKGVERGERNPLV